MFIYTLTAEALSQLLGGFSEQISVCKLKKIPYLTWIGWFLAVSQLGSSWCRQLQIGVERFGQYSETWMNLLVILGTENIISSSFIKQLRIDQNDLLPDMTNPFAIELRVAATLVGIIGCDTVLFNRNMPTFSGGNAMLEVSPSGPTDGIGRFSQQPGLPAYIDYTSQTVNRATGYRGGSLSYKFEEPVPLMASDLAQYLQSPKLFHDLWAHRCQCSNMAEFSLSQRTGFRIPALALLACDTPRAPRVFPSKQCRIWEAVRELSRLCNFWRWEGERTYDALKLKLGELPSRIAAI
jgi:hypothetical protein